MVEAANTLASYVSDTFDTLKPCPPPQTTKDSAAAMQDIRLNPSAPSSKEAAAHSTSDRVVLTNHGRAAGYGGPHDHARTDMQPAMPIQSCSY